MARRPASLDSDISGRCPPVPSAASRSDPLWPWAWGWGPWPPSADGRAPLRQQLPQDRAMTACFVLAVAAHGQVRLVRQGRQQVQEPGLLGMAHLRPVLLLEGRPVLVALGGLGLLHQR